MRTPNFHQELCFETVTSCFRKCVNICLRWKLPWRVIYWNNKGNGEWKHSTVLHTLLLGLTELHSNGQRFFPVEVEHCSATVNEVRCLRYKRSGWLFYCLSVLNPLLIMPTFVGAFRQTICPLTFIKNKFMEGFSVYVLYKSFCACPPHVSSFLTKSNVDLRATHFSVWK